MNNKIGIAGKIVSKAARIMPIYETDNLYSISVEIERKSGTKDTLVCIFDANAVDETYSIQSLSSGCDVMVYGSVQMYKDENKHFHMFIWAEFITIGKAEMQNEVQIQGIISKRPVLRETPLGRVICELTIQVPYIVGVEEVIYERKRYSCYIPCLAWGRFRNCRVWYEKKN